MRLALGTTARAVRRAGVAAALATALTAGLSGSLTPEAQAAAPTEQQWQADVQRAMQGAPQWLDSRVARGHGRLALNLDIDNTSLASYYDRGQPVAPVLDLARRAQAEGVSVLFNTGRQGRKVSTAVSLLQHAGYRVDGICGRHRGESLRHSKQRCRRAYVRQGYTLIGNVGNNRTDFVGRNYERAWKLPNYGGALS